MINKLASRLLGDRAVKSAPIGRGVALSYAELFVSLVASIFLTPLILRHLGQSAYGLWAAFGSVVGYFGLFDLGMNVATVKYTAEYAAKSELRELSKLVSTLLLALGGIGVAIVLVSLGLSPMIPRFFHLEGSLVYVGRIAFLIMGFNVALGLLAVTLNNIIYGFQRVDVIKSYAIIQTAVYALFVLLFLHWGWGLVGVVVAASLAVLSFMLTCIVFVYHSRYGISLNPKLAEIKTLKKIGPYSLRSFILGLTAQVLYRTDNIVIGFFRGVSSVTSYSIAYKVCYLGATIMFKVSDTLFPTFTRLYTLGDLAGLRSLYLRTARIALTIIVPFALFLVISGREVIDLWVGDQNFVGQQVLLVLIAMDFIHATSGPAAHVLQAIGKNKEFTYSAIADAILNLTLSIILCQRIGVLGVALGTLIAHLCTDTWVVIWLACRYIGLPVRTYLSSAILPPLLCAIPAGAIVWGLFRNVGPHGLLFSFVKGVLFVAIYLATQFLIGPPSEVTQEQHQEETSPPAGESR